MATYTASAVQLRPSASRSVRSGGRKKKLNASMDTTATGTAYTAPQRDRDGQHREDVQHTEAEHGRDRPQRVDQPGRRREGRNRARHTDSALAHSVTVP